jgi:ribosomal protein S18 acetylase RimI-like enzyme
MRLGTRPDTTKEQKMPQILPYAIKDFSRICQIYNASKLDELMYETSEFELIPLEQDAKRLPAFQECQTFVYCDENTDSQKITAYIAIYAHDFSLNTYAEIRGLFVHPDYRGFGVAKKLMKHVFDLFDEQNLELNVVQSNKVALALYRALGFEVNAQIQGEYNGVGVEVLTMQRPMLRAHDEAIDLVI